jgi:hypothetical protein
MSFTEQKTCATKKKKTEKHELKYEEQNCMLFVFLLRYIHLELYHSYRAKGKGKGKEQATKAQRGSRHIALLFLQPRSWMGVGGQHHAPTDLPPGKTRYPLYRRLGGPQG